MVISGEGRSFSAGFDLSDLDRQTDSDLVLRFIRIETLLQAIHNTPMATLALVHGRCIGAAADLFCVCHHRVAAPDATFRMPGLRFGIVLGTRRVSRLIGAEKAREVLETSKTINADEALRIGMVQHVAPIERWPDFIGDRAGAAGALDPAAQVRLLENTQASSDDADLADIVRSASVPGFSDRIRNFPKGPRNQIYQRLSQIQAKPFFFAWKQSGSRRRVRLGTAKAPLTHTSSSPLSGGIVICGRPR